MFFFTYYWAHTKKHTMKKQLLIMAALCAFAFTSNAQTEKGKNLIGGSINLSSSKISQGTQSQDSKEYGINPSYGHFFFNNLSIGIRGNVNHSKSITNFDAINSTNGIITNGTSVTNQKQTIYSVGPFTRYYVDITETFKFFGQFDANIGFGKVHQDTNGMNNTDDSKLTVYGASVSPNLAFFPTKKWAIELGFNLFSYNKRVYKQAFYESTVDNFNFGFNTFSPRLGLNYHF